MVSKLSYPIFPSILNYFVFKELLLFPARRFIFYKMSFVGELEKRGKIWDLEKIERLCLVFQMTFGNGHA